MSAPLHPYIPTPEQVDEHVRHILDRDSLNVGVEGRQDRLMLMLTRSCELRCTYCFVRLTEESHGVDHADAYRIDEGQDSTGSTPLGDMPLATIRKSVDWLLSSRRRRLGLQLFGGEPARRWDHVMETLSYITGHPKRHDRPIEILLTTNGVGLAVQRLEQLRRFPVRVQFSLDGDAHSSRFRRGHKYGQDEVNARTEAAIDALNESRVGWFMNATLPPAAAGEVLARYRWARERGVPALQINYVTGMTWNQKHFDQYLAGVQAALHHHHLYPGNFKLFNWYNDADPAPLCGDIIVDVDGEIYQVGALFHEKRSPELKTTYRLGHLDDELPFTNTRLSLAELAERTREAFTSNHKHREVFFNNVRLGAAVDLVVQRTKAVLGD